MPKGYAPRGGAVAVGVTWHGGPAVVVQGGADRTGEHYADACLYEPGGSRARRLEADAGDVALPLCGGHTAVTLPPCPSADGAAATATSSSGRTRIVLFGGINFVDEVVYDEVFEVSLAERSGGGGGGGGGGKKGKAKDGDAIPMSVRRPRVEGEAPLGRTGHAMVSLPLAPAPTSPSSEGGGESPSAWAAALLFGGSSPSDGVMADLHVLYAFDKERDGSASPWYRWQGCGTTGAVPTGRELHALFCRPGTRRAGGCSSPALHAAGASPAGPHRLAVAAGGGDTAAAAAAADEEPDALVVVGGRAGDGSVLAEVAVLDLHTLTWAEPVPAPCPIASAATGVSHGGRVAYLYGGWAGATELSGKLLRLDMREGGLDARRWSWTTISLSPRPLPPPRFAAAGCALPAAAAATPDDARLYVFGGMSAEEDLRDVLTITLPPLPPAAAH